MSRFTQSWLAAAAEALEGEFSRPVNLLPGAAIPDAAARFTLVVDIAGEWGGTFTVTVDESALSALLGARDEVKTPGEEAADGEDGAAGGDLASEEPQAFWQRLFRRICLAAAADLGTRSGLGCEVAMISPEETAVGSSGMGYQLRAGEPGESMMALMIADQVEAASAEPPVVEGVAPAIQSDPAFTARGIDLLRGVELEASLRFGSREMM